MTIDTSISTVLTPAYIDAAVAQARQLRARAVREYAVKFVALIKRLAAFRPRRHPRPAFSRG